jgi:hypothetical protein
MSKFSALLPFLKSQLPTAGQASRYALGAGIGTGAAALENSTVSSDLSDNSKLYNLLLGGSVGLFGSKKGLPAAAGAYLPKSLALHYLDAYKKDAPLRHQTAQLNAAAAADSKTTAGTQLATAQAEQASKGQWSTQDKIMAALAAAGIGGVGIYGINSILNRKKKSKGGPATKEILKGDPSTPRRQKLKIEVPASSLPPEFFQSLVDADDRERALTTLSTKTASFEFEVDRAEMLAGLASDLDWLHEKRAMKPFNWANAQGSVTNQNGTISRINNGVVQSAYSGGNRDANIEQAKALPASDPNNYDNVMSRFNQMNSGSQRMDGSGNIQGLQQGFSSRPGEQVTRGAGGTVVDGNPQLTAARERAGALPANQQATALAYDSRLQPYKHVNVGQTGTAVTPMTATGQPVGAAPAAPTPQPAAAPAAVPAPQPTPANPAAAVGAQMNPPAAQPPAPANGKTVTLPSGKTVSGIGPGGDFGRTSGPAAAPSQLTPQQMGYKDQATFDSAMGAARVRNAGDSAQSIAPSSPASAVGAQMRAPKSPLTPSSGIGAPTSPSLPAASPAASVGSQLPGTSAPSAPRFSPVRNGGAGGKRR